jgi:hypothetical protein
MTRPHPVRSAILLLVLASVPNALPAAEPFPIGVFELAVAPTGSHDRLARGISDLLSFHFWLDPAFQTRTTASLHEKLPNPPDRPYSETAMLARARELGLTWAVTGGVEMHPGRPLRVLVKTYAVATGAVVCRSERTGEGLSGLHETITAVFEETRSRLLGSAPRAATGGVKIDIMLALDVSGRMFRVLPEVKKTIMRFLNRLEYASPAADARYGLCLWSGGSVRHLASGALERDRLLEVLEQAVAAGEDPAGSGFAAIQREISARFSWRRDSQRFLAVYSAGHRDPLFFQEDPGLSRAGVRILAIPADGIDTASERALRRIAENSRGSVRRPVYYGETIFRDATRAWFLLSAGRLFRLREAVGHEAWQAHDDLAGWLESRSVRVWRSGSLEESLRLLEGEGKRRLASLEVSSDLDSVLFGGITAGLADERIRLSAPHPSARVRIQSGNQEAWLLVSARATVDRLAGWIGKGERLLGVAIQRAPWLAEGVRLLPHAVLALENQARIPALAMVSLDRLLASPAFYERRGILHPPRWFVPLRVLEVVRFAGPDFRFAD